MTNGEASEARELLSADTPTTTDLPWELVVTSKSMTLWSWAAVVGVMIIHIFFAVVVGIGYTGARVTTVDQWAFVGIGLLFSAVCLLGLRPRVRVNADGVEVRNFLGSQFYPWEVIHGLSFPRGAKWARLELPDFEFVPMWAFQVADGIRVIEAVDNFRVLEDRYLPEE